jgi:hypothetical protein
MHDYRGSRKHVLDWLKTGREPFRLSLSELLEGSGAVVEPSDVWAPLGYQSPREPKLDTNGLGILSRKTQQDLARWWLAHNRNANVPNWDLAAGCSIGGKKGLVLVEAKANAQELKTEGKKLDGIASSHQHKNHQHIAQAIEEARSALDKVVPGVRISRDSHYQLSNRIAFAWKLATLGVPVVLVCLGFLNDTGIHDAGEPFRDDAHWRSVFFDYVRGVLPNGFVEKIIPCGDASMRLIVRSRPVLEPSPPKRPRTDR